MKWKQRIRLKILPLCGRLLRKQAGSAINEQELRLSFVGVLNEILCNSCTGTKEGMVEKAAPFAARFSMRASLGECASELKRELKRLKGAR